MGPQIIDPLRKLPDLPQDPEGKERLKDVLMTLDRISRGGHSGAGLQGGRFLFDYCYVASRTRTGGVRLHVQNCVDRRTNKKYEEAYLTIAPDGQWDIRPIPLEDWH